MTDATIPESIRNWRSIIGLIQGLILYFLFTAVRDHHWPATHLTTLAVFLTLAFYLPWITIVCLGHLRQRCFKFTLICSMLLFASLAYYAVWRHLPAQSHADDLFLGMFSWIFSSMLGLFITLSLVLSSDQDQRWHASYSTYFDFSWKLIIQFFLSSVFTGFFWLILLLGSALLELTHITFLKHLLLKPWFNIPITALIFTVGLHITDARITLVRSVRKLLLILFSWLLPPTAILFFLFVFGLCLHGFVPLWNTHSSVSLLMAAGYLLIILINSAYQDGHAEQLDSRFLRFSLILGAWLLLPFVILACYGLHLRVAQWGWTNARIDAAVLILVCACYMTGYVLATLPTTRQLRWIEATNFYTALFIIIILTLLNTPLCDPARWSVSNQLTRWQAGITSQYAILSYLNRHGARYGLEALIELRAHAVATHNDPLMRAIDQLNITYSPHKGIQVLSVRQRAANINVLSKNNSLPQDFLTQDWQVTWLTPRCLTQMNTHCDAWIVNDHGQQSILLLANSDNQLIEFQRSAERKWQLNGYWTLLPSCRSMTKALMANQFSLVDPPVDHQDLKIGSQQIKFTPTNIPAMVCPD